MGRHFRLVRSDLVGIEFTVRQKFLIASFEVGFFFVLSDINWLSQIVKCAEQSAEIDLLYCGFEGHQFNYRFCEATWFDLIEFQACLLQLGVLDRLSKNDESQQK